MTHRLEDISQEIKNVFYPFVGVKSDTSSKYENDIPEFLMNYFENIDYFRKNPENFGLFPIEGDTLKRVVTWAMVRGEGTDAVVLIHHNDVVGIEDFKNFKPFAYDPHRLETELLHYQDNLPPEAKEDLLSGNYVFGRGTGDMKGGGSIQLALLKQYSSYKRMKGNIIVLSLPDEENTSAGMRAAILLLDKLRKEHGLNYKLMINSEPHQRTDAHVGVLSEGSVGKVMPFVYVRGSLAHAGKVYEGLNPLNVLSEIVRKTELSLELSDLVEGEAAPSPTWLYLRDRKEQYDVSMPLSTAGCFSVLTLCSDPDEILSVVKRICTESFDSVVRETNDNFKRFQEKRNKPFQPLPWKSKVITFRELYDEAYSNYGDCFLGAYDTAVQDVVCKLKNSEISMIEGNFKLVDVVYDHIKDLSPRVVVGLVPPYYPNVANINYDGLDEGIRTLTEDIQKYVKETFDQEYTREYFYTGISDLSYSSIKNSAAIEQSLLGSMPLYKTFYDLPLREIEDNSMPCINIGPWAKDFHKLTERVYKEDLFYRTPQLVNYTVARTLCWDSNSN